MKIFKLFIIPLTVLFVFSTAAIAGDFGWTKDFNIQAKADPSGFRSRFATRFNFTYVQANTLLTIFDTPADAYIMLRFGEMQGMLKKLSKKQGIAAIKKYRHNKGKGWVSMAKILEINSDSKEFHALKLGHDLPGGNNPGQVLYSLAYESSKAN